MEQYNQETNFNTQPVAKKKSKLPLILGIVAAVAVLVIAASVLFLGGKLSLASAYAALQEQLEEKMSTGIAASNKLLEKYSDEGTMNASFEIAEIPVTLVGDEATATAIEGSKMELSFDMSSIDKKMMLDADVNIAGMMEVGLDFYADEEVIQVKIPMLSEDAFELKNDDILGQISAVIPDLGLSGGKITFEKTDFETLINEFLEKYEERLDAANAKITVENGEKAEHFAFGKENVQCDTFNIAIPAEVINEYLACVEDYISNLEMFKMLGDSFSMETIEAEEGFELIVYTAKNGLFASNCIVGVDVDNIEADGEDDKSDSVEILFNGEKNVLDDITVVVEGEKLLAYTSTQDGTVATVNAVYTVDGDEIKITSNYDSKTGKLDGELKTNILGSQVKVLMEYVVKDEKGTVSVDEITLTVDADGEQLVLEGDMEYTKYESPSKISENPKEFNIQNIFSIIASLYGDMGGLTM